MIRCATALALAACLGAGEPLSVYYFGNSYLENSIPWFQPTMAATAGEQLRVATAIGPGWQIWMHVNAIERHAHRIRSELQDGSWNAVLVHQFADPGLVSPVPWKWDGPGRVWFAEPRDVGDVASAAAIIELLLATRPDGRAFVYSSWPGIPGAKDVLKRVRDEMERSLATGERREDTLKEIKERKLTLAELAPIIRTFDYGAAWLAPYAQGHPELGRNTHSRAYCEQLMAGLAVRFPALERTGRLQLIPGGEVFYALDQQMRAGKVPGLDNIGWFTRDGGHVRAGLPRYTLAATCFAVMFGRHPQTLDWSIYNDLDNYRTERLPQPGYVHQPDLGELLAITPELAKMINDTVWSVVTTLPACKVHP